MFDTAKIKKIDKKICSCMACPFYHTEIVGITMERYCNDAEREFTNFDSPAIRKPSWCRVDEIVIKYK
jgi:hypothetical protein